MGRALETLFYAMIVVLIVGAALYAMARYANSNTGARHSTTQTASQGAASPPPPQ